MTVFLGWNGNFPHGGVNKQDWPIPFASRELTVNLLLRFYHFCKKKVACDRDRKEKSIVCEKSKD